MNIKKIIPVATVIILVLAIAVTAVKIYTGKKAKKTEYREYAQSVTGIPQKDGKSEHTYEFLQTDPDSGLAVIYTFEIAGDENGISGGRMIVDGKGTYIDFLCAVAREDDADVFIFSSVADGSDAYDAQQGDILAKLHKKDGKVFVEWVTFKSMVPGAETFANYGG